MRKPTAGFAAAVHVAQCSATSQDTSTRSARAITTIRDSFELSFQVVILSKAFFQSVILSKAFSNLSS
jgi:hypothetical protein